MRISSVSTALIVLSALMSSSLVPASANTLSASGKRQLERIYKMERKQAEVVVIGQWTNFAPGCPKDLCRGSIAPLAVERGPGLPEYPIAYRIWLDLVRGTNLAPDDGICGKFYLKRSDEEHYEIIQFVLLRKESKKCSRKS